jgi:hypothetical protein
LLSQEKVKQEGKLIYGVAIPILSVGVRTVSRIVRVFVGIIVLLNIIRVISVYDTMNAITERTFPEMEFGYVENGIIVLIFTQQPGFKAEHNTGQGNQSSWFVYRRID